MFFVPTKSSHQFSLKLAIINAAFTKAGHYWPDGQQILSIFSAPSQKSSYMYLADKPALREPVICELSSSWSCLDVPSGPGIYVHHVQWNSQSWFYSANVDQTDRLLGGEIFLYSIGIHLSDWFTRWRKKTKLLFYSTLFMKWSNIWYPIKT